MGCSFLKGKGRVNGNVQTIDSHDIFSRVRGKEQMKEMTMPTIPKTMEQVPWFVIVFMATVKVKR